MIKVLRLCCVMVCGAACSNNTPGFDGGFDANGESPPACQGDYPATDPGPGNLVWALRAGGPSFVWGLSTVQLSDRSILVVGVFENTVIFGVGEARQTAVTSRGSSDIFLARFCPDGSLGWARSEGGS